MSEQVFAVINRAEEKREAVSALCSFVMQHYKIGEEKTFYLKLVLNELIDNSLRCQSGCSQVRTVAEIKLSPFTRGVNITISDSGAGFNPKETLKRLKEDIESCLECGRGLLLVREISRSMKFNKRGNRVSVDMKL
ncbi:MAG: ATP-binding protein [Bacillota bacterium]|nr:ATP-binding protein [Bacillota bacterium]